MTRRSWTRRRDPRQVRVLSAASLRWAVRERAWTPYYLVRYLRYARMRLAHPDVVTEGMVFLGRRVRLEARPGYGRIVLGAWCHLGDDTKLRAHNGTLRIGEKVVLGHDNTVNAHLDIEIGAATLVSDWCYVCDFDHGTDDLTVPIKDQPLVTAPVSIGPGSWLCAKVTVLRGTRTGPGVVLAAHTVARGEYPAHSVVGGAPGRVLRTRGADPGEQRRREAYVAAVAREQALARAATAVPRPPQQDPGRDEPGYPDPTGRGPAAPVLGTRDPRRDG